MDECNKEEAQRAKQIAEKKFTLKDLKSAKKFALKSEKLFPSLEISQLISTLDVYLSSENRYGEDPDWYGILGLSPFSDEDLVKKQYRKLALILHPDKNKSIGAEGAFKLISEAWSILSDTNNKTIYDQKRKSFTTNNNNNNNININNNNNNNNNVGNNNNNFGNENKINKRNKNKSKKRNGSNGSGTIRTGVDTFWTSCNRCRMQYEYLRIYLNHNLLCPNCHNAFMAVETGFPSNGNNNNSNSNNNNSNLKNNSNSNLSYSGSKNSNLSYSGSKNSNSGYENNTSFTWETQPAKVNKANNNNNNRRKHEDTKMYEYNYDYNNYGSNNNNNNASSNYNFSYSSGGSANVQFNNSEKIAKRPGRPPKRRKYTYGETSYNTNNININNNINIIERPLTGLENLNGFAQMANSNTIINNNYGVNYVNNSSSRMPYKRNSFRDLSQADIRSILIEKAKEKISKKLAEFQISTSKKHQSFLQQDAQNDHFTPIINDSRKIVKVMGQPASITVPDPDFYDFDQDRTEKKFDSDQVWATYDSEDGMPRLYAIIQKITKKPFSIKMSFLNSKSNSDLGPINWVSSGFTKTLGDFRVGRYQITDTVNIFSHRVQFEKGPRGIVKILPKKGETWAVYKNWAPNWNELTPDEIIYKYEIVEIVTDFEENLGFLEVLPMVKVAGFKAVFYRHMDPKEVKKIPKEEMFRFSHGIPNKLLLGNEGQNGQNAPKGCVELDPAATPVELLQIIN